MKAAQVGFMSENWNSKVVLEASQMFHEMEKPCTLRFKETGRFFHHRRPEGVEELEQATYYDYERENILDSLPELQRIIPYTLEIVLVKSVQGKLEITDVIP